MPQLLGLTNSQSQMQASGGMNMNGSGSASMGKQGSEESDKKKKKDRSTIWGRTQADAREMDTLFWRALCDEPETALEYTAHDCALINPLLLGDEEEVTNGTEDIRKALKDCQPFDGYRIRDFHAVEVGLMAVTTIYRVTVALEGGEKVECFCSSSWRQTAGADWQLCGQLLARA